MARISTLAIIANVLFHCAYSQTTPNPNCTPLDSNRTYDYIVIGSGAGGIPIADRLSEAGHSVLLVERGPLSSGRWNGTMKPTWLEGTNLTRFDVPGLFNQIWADPTGVNCEDYDVMAGW
jgi:cellobiose dehydrogenase (acceptor)